MLSRAAPSRRSEILGDFPELLDRSARMPRHRRNAAFEALVDVIVALEGICEAKPVMLSHSFHDAGLPSDRRGAIYAPSGMQTPRQTIPSKLCFTTAMGGTEELWTKSSLRPA